jgi:hypothetical protein
MVSFRRGLDEAAGPNKVAEARCRFRCRLYRWWWRGGGTGTDNGTRFRAFEYKFVLAPVHAVSLFPTDLLHC